MRGNRYILLHVYNDRRYNDARSFVTFVTFSTSPDPPPHRSVSPDPSLTLYVHVFLPLFLGRPLFLLPSPPANIISFTIPFARASHSQRTSVLQPSVSATYFLKLCIKEPNRRNWFVRLCNRLIQNVECLFREEQSCEVITHLIL